MNDSSKNPSGKSDRSADEPRQLEGQIDDLLNQGLDREQADQLDQQLSSDANARRVYLQRMFVEAELHAYHAEPVSSDDHRREAPVADPSATSTEPARRPLSAWAAIAASLLAVASLSSLLTLAATGRFSSHAHNQLAHSDSQPETPAEAVATIGATQNCRWKATSQAAGAGAKLPAGAKLELEAGVAEIAFADGARLLLEGPACLDINDGHDARLVYGQLSAKLPEGPDRLNLAAGRLAIAEGSTAGPAEFGLLADGSGGGEVHVFGGSVGAVLFGPQGQQLRSLSLNKFEAARVTQASTSLARFNADGDRFVRSLSSGNGLYAYEPFDYTPGPLSWQNGGFGWAGAWEDIEFEEPEVYINDCETTNQVAAGSLGIGELATAGNHAIQTAQRNRIRRVLSTSIGSVLSTAGFVENSDGHNLVGRDGKRLYVSFVQRVDRLDDVFYGLELNRGDGNGNRVLCIGNGADGAGYGVTSNYNAYGARNYKRLGEETLKANLMVMRFDFGVDNRDVVTVYRNPESLLDEDLCTKDAVLRGNFAFDRLSLGNFDGSKNHEVDEVRIGSSFRAATGLRDPKAPMIRPLARQWRRFDVGELRVVKAAAWLSNSPFGNQGLDSLGGRY
ncbi:MAG: hypothetical protein AAGJ46_06130 [Planctomycetota bacterium]